MQVAIAEKNSSTARSSEQRQVQKTFYAGIKRFIKVIKVMKLFIINNNNCSNKLKINYVLGFKDFEIVDHKVITMKIFFYT